MPCLGIAMVVRRYFILKLAVLFITIVFEYLEIILRP